MVYVVLLRTFTPHTHMHAHTPTPTHHTHICTPTHTTPAHSNAVVTAPGILELQKCTAEDEGLYTCTVSNKWGTSSRTFSLTIPKG